ncbi:MULTISPECIES: regulatory protein RecX [Protofrankia]|uniref:Regulatory protein RecX n=1 Tax=Protofrankia coriariae TaxID=1562887 RepID=A0ABR5F8C1_9ACTN|nr:MULTISPECIES: regulatory protein RecX [Protofrankia]KLL12890.1 recombinase RecX [Protofrankia coriariae]ONH36516.1 recombination regulator RecX [Protofrankia sp. BMG5.30]
MKEAADPVARAREICLRQLEARPRSHAELAATLARRGVDPDTAQAVLARLAEVGLVDDRAFATALISSARANRGLGRHGLVHELRRRGVDADVIAAALADQDDLDTHDEEAAARELVRRRMPAMAGLPAQVRTRRLAALLGRRGYPSDLVVRVITEEVVDGSLD